MPIIRKLSGKSTLFYVILFIFGTILDGARTKFYQYEHGLPRKSYAVRDETRTADYTHKRSIIQWDNLRRICGEQGESSDGNLRLCVIV